MSGNATSISIRSGARLSTASIAALPDSASPSTCRSLKPRHNEANSERTAGSLSTMMSLMAGGSCSASFAWAMGHRRLPTPQSIWLDDDYREHILQRRRFAGAWDEFAAGEDESRDPRDERRANELEASGAISSQTVIFAPRSNQA